MHAASGPSPSATAQAAPPNPWGLLLTQLWLLYLVHGHFHHSGLTALLEGASVRAFGGARIEVTVMAGFLLGALGLGGVTLLVVHSLHSLGLRPGALRDLFAWRHRVRVELALLLSMALGAAAVLLEQAQPTQALVCGAATLLFAAQIAHSVHKQRSAR